DGIRTHGLIDPNDARYRTALRPEVFVVYRKRGPLARVDSMTQSPITLTDRVRRVTNEAVSSAGSAVHKAGIHPDTITLIGTALVGVAAVFIASGQLQVGALLLLLSLPLDALDGAVARAMQRKDQFGGLLDSTLDRYADGFIFGALGYYFASLGQQTNLVLALAALLGSYGASSCRAAAGERGWRGKVGGFRALDRWAAFRRMRL